MSSPEIQLRQIYRALSDGDIGSVLSSMDDNIEWHVAEGNPFGDGNRLSNPGEVAQTVFAPVVDVVDGFQISPVQFHDLKGEGILAEVRYQGTRKSDGERFDVQAAHLWHFRNGRAVRFQQYMDTWTWSQVVGNPAN